MVFESWVFYVLVIWDGTTFFNGILKYWRSQIKIPQIKILSENDYGKISEAEKEVYQVRASRVCFIASKYC